MTAEFARRVWIGACVSILYGMPSGSLCVVLPHRHREVSAQMHTHRQSGDSISTVPCTLRHLGVRSWEGLAE